MNRQARVVVAYATVKVLDPATGKPTVCGFYKDSVLPANADPANVEALVRREYAAWINEEPVPEPVKVEEPKVEEPAKEPAKAEVKVEAPKPGPKARD